MTSAKQQPPVRPGAGQREARDSAFARRFSLRLGEWMDRTIPLELWSPPETARRARLTNRFGFLGAFSGSVFALFYLLIGHWWGALIVVLCSTGFAATPFLMRWKKSVEPAAHFLSCTQMLGFTALCFVEGGLRGHAIAWLVSVPLCSLILVGEKSAARWALITFAAASLVISFDLAGKHLPVTYDPKWESVVSAAGYLGLILFMFILGLIFESGRARAFDKVQAVLMELATSNERLVYLNSEKDEFLGIAAHDLKNPLTVIAGSAELVMLSKDPNQINKLSKNIVAAATRMRDLIANLLDVHAIEEGRFTSKVEKCDVRTLVQQSLENNQTPASRKEIVFSVEMLPGLEVRADRTATLQILDNLISNALKYSPLKTTIHIRARLEKEAILVAVRDEGPGISESDQLRLFQKFTRLSARPTGGESSNGLGLAIVKRLAQAMSGSIECQSALGSGATFTLRLPAWPNESTTAAASPAAVLPTAVAVTEWAGQTTGRCPV